MKQLDYSFLGIRQSIYSMLICFICFAFLSCDYPQKSPKEKAAINAESILGNPSYPAISYGGYRGTSRDIQPTLVQLQNDIKILHAMGIRVLRTYDLQFDHSPNLLKAIDALQKEDPSFEMYVILGSWIDCKGAWTDQRDHSVGAIENNTLEMEKAVRLANQYPHIVKVIAVGNEAMVHWQEAYYVKPDVILKWVNHLQGLKKKGKLPTDLWITSSDNFASWGGGDDSYHLDALTQLIKAVDYLSIHTYPFHDTHYNEDFWVTKNNENASKEESIEAAMIRAVAYAIGQYNAVKNHLVTLGVDKPIHIGESGWSTASEGFYGDNGSHAADEYKQALYYQKIQEWSKQNNITTVYFSAFDEQWKDPNGPLASENNFGLFTIDGKAKYALWPLVDKGVFKGLSREENGPQINKTFEGNLQKVLAKSKAPKTKA